MLASEDLHFFTTLAAHQSLAAAARSLHVTPPSVTQRLQGIERRLGLKLVIRQGRGIVLTGEGQLLAERARTILADIESLQDALTHRKQDLVGRLAILAPLGFGGAYIAPLAARFKAAHPHLSLDLHLSDDPVHAPARNWDLVIHIGELRDSSLRRTVLAPNRRFLCASPDYLTRCGEPEDANALRRHVCIALRENAEDVTMWRMRPPGAPAELSVRIQPALASNDGRVVKQWALDGYGVIMRSEWDVARELREGRLVRVLPDHVLPSADIVALTPDASAHSSARTRYFLEFLQAEVSPALWAGPSQVPDLL